MEQIDTQCCIAGGGPAGLMLGYILARAGVDVVVLEKHADFLRDFRGDTIHPSTLELLRELGDLPDFLKLPHTKFHTMSMNFEGREYLVADFAALPVEAGYVAMMPQWDFLDFLADRARTYPNFRLILRGEVTAPVMTGDKVTGVTAVTPDGALQINAALTVAADGRGSTLRAAAGMKVTDLGAPIDVLWFRLSRKDSDSGESLGHIKAGKIFVMLNRGDYWQCAHVVAKGEGDQVRAAGLQAFRALLDRTLGLDADRSAEITDWDQVKTLDVQVNRLETWWRDGLLFIGDAAHAMSPIGGIGINLAIQDAVAAANILAQPLKNGTVTRADLAAVQTERLFPTRVTQRVQVIAQDRIIAPAIAAKAGTKAPWPFRFIGRFPWLARFPARFIGLGVRREHIRPGLL